MKTIINSKAFFTGKAAMIGIILVLFAGINDSFSQNNTEFSLDEEEYVDDIPFDTEKIFHYYMSSIEKEPGMQEFTLEDEAYAYDIHFDTEDLFAQFYGEEMDKRIIGLSLDEEPYYDDISFDTKLIAAEVINRNNPNTGQCNTVSFNTTSYLSADLQSNDPVINTDLNCFPNSRINSFSFFNLTYFQGLYKYHSSQLFNKILDPLKFEGLDRILYKAISY